MARALRVLAMVMGIACVAIGVAHFVFGVASVPGETAAGATVDSRERFYAAVFAGYGLAWIWVARQVVVPVSLVRWLAAIFFVGGLGRALSLATEGSPQWFQVALLAIELVVPPIFVVLTRAGEPRPTVATRQPTKGRAGVSRR